MSAEENKNCCLIILRTLQASMTFISTLFNVLEAFDVFDGDDKKEGTVLEPFDVFDGEGTKEPPKN